MPAAWFANASGLGGWSKYERGRSPPTAVMILAQGEATGRSVRLEEEEARPARPIGGGEARGRGDASPPRSPPARAHRLYSDCRETGLRFDSLVPGVLDVGYDERSFLLLCIGYVSVEILIFLVLHLGAPASRKLNEVWAGIGAHSAVGAPRFQKSRAGRRVEKPR